MVSYGAITGSHLFSYGMHCSPFIAYCAFVSNWIHKDYTKIRVYLMTYSASITSLALIRFDEIL